MVVVVVGWKRLPQRNSGSPILLRATSHVYGVLSDHYLSLNSTPSFARHFTTKQDKKGHDKKGHDKKNPD
jgi:hypothetical protein